ncbi:hypothetical protein GGI42DRAFT_269405 [Trichoderma sp. SZMC 28013]
MAEPLCRLPLGEPTLKLGAPNWPLTTSTQRYTYYYTNYDDERFQALVQLPLPPMRNHVGCVCRAVRASRCGSVPSNLVLPGGLAWVAEMAWRIWCCKAAIATIHQLSCVMACAVTVRPHATQPRRGSLLIIPNSSRQIHSTSPCTCLLLGMS